MSWRKIPAAKLDKLRMIHTKAEEERERRARKRRAEEAALSENNSAAGAALSSQTKRASASRDSESGPGGMPLSGGTPPLPPSSQPPILLHRVARGNGRVHWTCTGCGNFFNELNATKAAALQNRSVHVLAQDSRCKARQASHDSHKS